MTKELSQELVREFVLAAHGNLDKVKEMADAEPALIKARYLEFDEDPLEAASHMGNREIAQFLLAQGVPTTICTSAMMGQLDEVEQFLRNDPALVQAKGAHGITLMFHAALSGNTQITDLLLARGNGEGLSHALHAAVMHNHVEMVAWLLAHDAEPTTENFQGLTPLAAAEKMGRQAIIDLLKSNGVTV